MREETSEQVRPLRSGYTTGACATATSLAAARLLLEGLYTDCCTITLPKGQQVEFTIAPLTTLSDKRARATTIKDAGDDPDVTHGAHVFAEVELIETAGIQFYAAKGVGTVTREGLLLACGDPAINPIPRKMMIEHLQALAQTNNYEGGFDVFIGVEEGEHLAPKTMNPRLGILGGLSILGTTGIVRPFSCSAYIASIQQGMDVAFCNGHSHIAACTGSTSEACAIKTYSLPEMALIEMGDFVGAVLKHVKNAPITKLSLFGGFGKFAKLAMGEMDLHSRKSSIDLSFLAKQAQELGAKDDLLELIISANTSLQALRYCQDANIDLAGRICTLACNVAATKVPSHTQVEVWAIHRKGHILGHAGWQAGRKGSTS